VKIGQYLAKMWTRVWCLLFLTHGVYLYDHLFSSSQAWSATFDFNVTRFTPEFK